MSLDGITRDDFARRVGSSWTVEGCGPATLELVEVSPAKVSGPWEMFSVVFRGVPDGPLEQGTYALVDEELGALDLFVVPLAPDADGARYECVFTRAAPLAAAGG